MDTAATIVLVLLPIAIVLSNIWLKTTVQRSVNHRYDEKLEQLRSDLRRSEEGFRAELRQKELEIASLRDGALAARAQRHALVDKRRLEAIENLWKATKDLGRFRYVSSLNALIKFEPAAQLAEKDPEVRELFKQMASSVFEEKNERVGMAADVEEPFLSPLSWALFSAYRAVLTFAVARWKLLVIGIGDDKYLNGEALRKMLAAALPERIEWINQADLGAFHHLLEELEAKLLAELRRVLSGHEDDEETVKRAVAISKLAAEIGTNQQNAEAQIPVGLRRDG